MAANSTQLAAIVAKLDDEADRETLAEALAPAWLRRQRRFAERDAAIRETVQRFFPGRQRPSAEALENALTGYLAGAWRWEREGGLPGGASARRAALHRILVLNRGEPLGWRRIFDILADG